MRKAFVEKCLPFHLSHNFKGRFFEMLKIMQDQRFQISIVFNDILFDIFQKVTKEGELLPFFQQELTVGADGSDDRLMFIWPTLIVHVIDEDSPLYNLSAQDMLKDRFEIVTMLEGTVESTGMTTQARSSYLPSEILWGHRFDSIVSFKRETGEYEVN